MPHQCVRCGTIYDDTAQEILKGCKCGGRLFFYIKKERLSELKEATVSLTEAEKKEIEKDVIDMVGMEEVENQPIVLDFESVRVMKPGKYELDLVRIFKQQPLVFKIADGKYLIDLPSAFHSRKEKQKKAK